MLPRTPHNASLHIKASFPVLGMFILISLDSLFVVMQHSRDPKLKTSLICNFSIKKR